MLFTDFSTLFGTASVLKLQDATSSDSLSQRYAASTLVAWSRFILLAMQYNSLMYLSAVLSLIGTKIILLPIKIPPSSIEINRTWKNSSIKAEDSQSIPSTVEESNNKFLKYVQKAIKKSAGQPEGRPAYGSFRYMILWRTGFRQSFEKYGRNLHSIQFPPMWIADTFLESVFRKALCNCQYCTCFAKRNYCWFPRLPSVSWHTHLQVH